MRICRYCGSEFTKRKSEAYWQYEARLFCSRPCADLGRKTTRVENVDFKARYRQIKINGKRYLEHRYVMEQKLGRPLLRTEQVHHINHDRLDNRPENLEVVTTAEHGLRHTWRPLQKTCQVCGQVFTPHKTKRARAKTCGRPECFRTLMTGRRKKT